MADYIYLLENRLSDAQQRAIRIVRNLARAQESTIFLTGGAVRDLTAGSAVRDLDLTVVGEVVPLRKQIEAEGALFTGENGPAKALYFLFPGGVRVEVNSAVSVEFPKPGKPVYTAGNIIDDLRRRDFTANAMALSLNEGSYGLLMDPLNGVADIENRELRLISNYGFMEDPTRMLRAVRLSSRLGWQMEERTRQRYDNAKAEDLFGTAPKFHTAYELEEIFYEEDPVRIMRALDAEGWLKLLSPQLAAAKPNEAGLADLREKQGQLLTQGVLADAASLALPLLLGKTAAADVEALKKSFARSGFAKQVDSLETRTRELQIRFSGKEAATPSAAWRMLHQADPELVLSMLVSGKGSVQTRLKTFLNESPTARQRIPYAMLQEMRITPDLPVYAELLDKLFFELMDGKLGTPEEMKAYLEPYSPPAPPPPVNLRRARAKKEARPSRSKAKKAVAETVAEKEEGLGAAEGLMESGTLTGPDRGTEPTVATPLEGKVAPLAPGEAEPSPGAPKRPTKPAKAPAVAAEADTPAARKLPAKPAPIADKQGKAATTPHPQAAREIAAKRPAMIPATPAKSAKAEAPVRRAAKVAAPVKKAAATKPVARPAVQAKKAVSKTAPKGAKKTATPAKKAVKATANKAVATKAAKATRTAAKPAPKSAKPSPKPTKKAPAKASKPTAKKAAPPKKAAVNSPSKAAKKTAAKKAVAKTPAKKTPAKTVAKKAPAKKTAPKPVAKKTAKRR